MIKKLDKWIETKIRDHLAAQRQQLIDTTIARFQQQHPTLPLGDLRNQLEDEADRVYDIVDQSILRDRIIRAKYTFFGAGVAGALFAGFITGFSGGAATPFVTPVTSAFTAYVLSVATIPISCILRIRGGLNSTVRKYLKTIRKKEEESAKKSSSAQILVSVSDRKLDHAVVNIAMPQNTSQSTTDVSRATTSVLPAKVQSSPHVALHVLNASQSTSSANNIELQSSATSTLVMS